MRRTATVLVAVLIGLVPLIGMSSVAHAAATTATSQSALASTPKPGQFCKKADRGVHRAGLTCRKDPKNSRYSRWYR